MTPGGPHHHERNQVTAVSTAGDAQITRALNAAANGTATLEAAVMLLTDSGCWLDREDFTSQFTIASSDGPSAASIDWEAAISGHDGDSLAERIGITFP
jgi:hypothetical protein